MKSRGSTSNGDAAAEKVTGKSVARLRREYSDKPLLEEDLLDDPIRQFEIWLNDSIAALVYEPNAMVLSTASADGSPSSRAVLLKGFDERGFTFFTNYESRKGAEIAENPRAALLFYWPELHRQVRAEGVIAKVPRAASAEYFATRPRGAQLGAWASAQSRTLGDRSALEEEVARLETVFAGKEIKCPPFWGGYRVSPVRIEFWQGRRNRLHDRLVYSRRTPRSRWVVSRLSP